MYTILSYETEVTKSSSNRLVVLVDSYLGATLSMKLRVCPCLSG